MSEVLHDNNGPLLKTNLDTDFLKLIAVLAMVIDHIGRALYPESLLLRIIGRISFPLFCYCMTVGLLYTRNIGKYLLRIGIFALISQPFYVLAFHPDGFWQNLGELNIFFALFVNLLGAWAVKERKWWLLAAVVILLGLVDLDYDYLGLTLMLIFLFCRNQPALGAVLFTAAYLPSFIDQPDYIYYAVHIGDYSFNIAVFALLSGFLIFIKTDTKIHLSKWFFYAFYPLHLFLIFLVKLF